MAEPIGMEDVVACPALPSLPAIAVQVLDLTADPTVRLEEIARVVGNDQALVGKILRTVNSSYYSLSKPCPSISRAMAYLGLNTVKALTLGFSLVDVTRQSKGLNLIDYWRRCIHSAVAARRISVVTERCDPEEAFLAALMQDIGMLAIHAALPDPYPEVIRRAGGDHGRLLEAEREAFGFDHAQVGAELARRWRFPDQLVEPILHHDHANVEPGEYEAVVETVLLAGRIAAVLHSCNASSLGAACDTASRFFGMLYQDVKTLVLASAEDAANVAGLLGVKIGDRAADVRAILAEADDARIRLQLGQQREAEQLRQSNEELTKQVLTDALTRVGNRQRFNQELAEQFELASANGSCLGVVIADADRFKCFNDTHGHQAGDAVLVEIALRMNRLVGDAGTVCRYGGEEFVAILPGADRMASTRTAERLRQALATTPIDLSEVKCDASHVSVTISLGVAVLEPNAGGFFTRPEMLVRAADQALYAAKSAGRNCVRIFSARRGPSQTQHVA
ncbi:MAG: GGDEF domain-containing protein [Phycisphaerales bacterium]|nr:MAG: GGDEF domain-containing protein [Phycisphaerales bacterium]